MKRLLQFSHIRKTVLLWGVFIFLSTGMSEAAEELSRRTAWPNAATASYLRPSPNGIGYGDHQNYGADGILILASGDTVAVYNGTDISLIRSFRIENAGIINDFEYRDDAGAERLYVAAGKGGLYIFDLASVDTAVPALLGRFSASAENPGYRLNTEGESEAVTTVNAMGIGYYGSTVFLADNYFGLRVIDVTNPATPTEIPLTTPDPDNVRISGYIQPNIYGSFDTTGGYVNAEVIRFNGKTYAAVLDYYYGLRVFDVTDPAVIAAPASKDMRTNILYGSSALVTDLFPAVGSDSELYTCVTAVNVYGDESVVAKLKILDDSDMLSDESIVNIGRYVTPGGADGLYVVGDTAHVADTGRGLRIVDVLNGTPNDQGVLTYSETGAYEENLAYTMSTAVSGNRLFLTDTRRGVVELDISDETAPAYVRAADPVLSAESIAYAGGYIYTLDSETGLRIFNHATPVTLALESFLGISGTTSDILVSGSYAFIAADDSGLKSVNVSDPENPVQGATKATTGTLVALSEFTYGENRYLLAADSAGGAITFDITSPDAPGDPVAVSTAGFTAGTAVDTAAMDHLACYADTAGGMKVIRISGAPPLTVAGEKDTSGNALAVAIMKQDQVYYGIVSDDTDGILIENITDPTTIPATVGRITPPDGAVFTALETEGQYLIATTAGNGMFLYDLADPTLPVKIADSQTAGIISGIDTYTGDGYICLVTAETFNGISSYTINTDLPEPAPLNDGVDTGCFLSAVGAGL